MKKYMSFVFLNDSNIFIYFIESETVLHGKIHATVKEYIFCHYHK